MSSSLSAIPAARRRQLAATLGLFAALFVAVGLVAATGADTGVVRSFAVIALVAAIPIALLAWGVAQSIRIDSADHRLDAAIEQALAASPGGFASLCDCGHEHDPTVLHVTDAEPAGGPQCARECAHPAGGPTCDTCALTGMRTAPSVTARPSPAGRRPSPSR